MTAPLLVLGWGNLSRGDDALGPLFVQRLHCLIAGVAALERMVDLLDDHQLQIEHALDLAGRKRVLFVDASSNCAAPFEVTALHPARDASLTTHAISPAAVLQVYRDLYRAEPPQCTQLAIRGRHFILGEPPGDPALDHLSQALGWARCWLTGAIQQTALSSTACSM